MSTSSHERGLEKNKGSGVAPGGDVNGSSCGAGGGVVGSWRRLRNLGGGLERRLRHGDGDAHRVGGSGTEDDDAGDKDGDFS